MISYLDRSVAALKASILLALSNTAAIVFRAKSMNFHCTNSINYYFNIFGIKCDGLENKK